VKILLILFGAIVVILVVALRFRGGSKKFPFYEFYSRGRKEGFSFKEISFLKKIAIQNKLEKPQAIFWSTRQLDRCLRPAISKINADESMSPADKIVMINKLLELRKKAEFNLPKYHKRIRESTALLPRQKLIIREKSYGTYISWVVENNRRHLVVSRPMGQKASKSLNWVGKKVNVYFWRQDDAGYTFDSKVLEEHVHQEYPLVYLQHSNRLKRVQKRKSVRIETNLRGRFFPVVHSTAEGASRPFISKKGHTCRIIDISESGCAMIAGRGLKKNDRFKFDFFLTDEKQIIALCTVVGISKTSDERVHKYHVTFTRIGVQARNNILLYVYNIFGEREEEPEVKKKVAIAATAVAASALAAKKTSTEKKAVTKKTPQA